MRLPAISLPATAERLFEKVAAVAARQQRGVILLLKLAIVYAAGAGVVGGLEFLREIFDHNPDLPNRVTGAALSLGSWFLFGGLGLYGLSGATKRLGLGDRIAHRLDLAGNLLLGVLASLFIVALVLFAFVVAYLFLRVGMTVAYAVATHGLTTAYQATASVLGY